MADLVSMGKVLLKPFSFVSSLLFHYFFRANHHYDNVVGTLLQALLQACAWAHANPIVVEHITLLSTMSDCRQQNLKFKIRDRLSVADTIALVGVTKAAAFVAAYGFVGYKILFSSFFISSLNIDSPYTSSVLI